jgi:hypothetical protein
MNGRNGAQEAQKSRKPVIPQRCVASGPLPIGQKKSGPEGPLLA